MQAAAGEDLEQWSQVPQVRGGGAAGRCCHAPTASLVVSDDKLNASWPARKVGH